MTEEEAAVVRALCIILHQQHSLTDADAPFSAIVKEQLKLGWARDIVRQVANQPMPMFEGGMRRD